MDKSSHFTWELTRDELSTIWYAVIERAERLEARAKKEGPEESNLSLRLAAECRDLQGQINRMRNRSW